LGDLGWGRAVPGIVRQTPNGSLRLLFAANMPIARMRMRPWLEMQINSNQIPGLIWINKVSGTLGVPPTVLTHVLWESKLHMLLKREVLGGQ
jgi:hypothetical protein